MRRRTWLLGIGAAVVALAVPVCVLSQGPKLETDLTFGTAGGEELKLDFVRPTAGDGPFPLVVFIHGGGWRIGNRRDNHGLMQGAAKAGYAAASIQYRFAPKHKFPAQLDDVRQAFAYLRKEAERLRIDPDRVVVAGGSAGGHLALLAGFYKDANGERIPGIRGIVYLCGPTAFVHIKIPDDGNAGMKKAIGVSVDDLINDLLGTPDRSAAIAKEASPVTYIDKNAPPVLTMHGEKDNIVPADQARILHAALKEAGVPEKLVLLEGAGHDLGGQVNGARMVLEMLSFLKERLGKKQSGE